MGQGTSYQDQRTVQQQQPHPWRIRSGKFVLDIETVKEGTNHVRCEFWAIIGEKSGRYARNKWENFMLKSTNDGWAFLVPDWDCCHPLGEVVHKHQTGDIPSGGTRKTHQVCCCQLKRVTSMNLECGRNHSCEEALVHLAIMAWSADIIDYGVFRGVPDSIIKEIEHFVATYVGELKMEADSKVMKINWRYNYVGVWR